MRYYYCIMGGYAISLLAGVIIEPIHNYLTRKADAFYNEALDGARDTKPYAIGGYLMGIIERIIYSTLIGFEVNAAGAFIGGWITAKAIGGWSVNPQGTRYRKELLSVNLMASGISAVFGIVGGLLIKYGLSVRCG
ncbi:MAG: hypothetical protein ACLP9S_13885 [Syntrophales bacterium]